MNIIILFTMYGLCPKPLSYLNPLHTPVRGRWAGKPDAHSLAALHTGLTTPQRWQENLRLHPKYMNLQITYMYYSH